MRVRFPFHVLVPAVLLFFPLSLLAATVTVTPTNIGSWQLQNSTCGVSNTGTTAFEAGPGTPPLGDGSAELTVGTDGDSFNTFRYTGLDGVLLSSLTALDYSTYVDIDGSGGQAAYLLLNVDYDGDALADDFLFFEPVYQDATFFPSNPQASLALDTWQTWDALNGGWWSVNGTASATPGTGVKSLATIIAAEPGARIVNGSGPIGGFRVASGCGAGSWDNFVGNFDAVSIEVSGSDTTFDFELAPVAFIGDVSQNEGNGPGTTTFTFTVSLSEGVSQTVTLDYVVNDGTAFAGADYADESGTVTFVPFDTSEEITVEVVGDPFLEPDENFFIVLSNPSNATISDDTGEGTILNDDVATADLEVTKDALFGSVQPGGEIRYRITVTNHGPQMASDVTVTDPLPAGTTLVSADPSQGSCSGTTTVICDLDSLAVDATATIFLVLNAPTTPGTITNTATATNTPEPDTDPTNNAGAEAVAVAFLIPTASEWGLLALALVLAGLAIVILRS